MNLLLELDHFDLDGLASLAIGTDDRRESEGIGVGDEFDAAAKRHW